VAPLASPNQLPTRQTFADWRCWTLHRRCSRSVTPLAEPSFTNSAIGRTYWQEMAQVGPKGSNAIPRQERFASACPQPRTPSPNTLCASCHALDAILGREAGSQNGSTFLGYHSRRLIRTRHGRSLVETLCSAINTRTDLSSYAASYRGRTIAS
jgi:hypothetical protein